MTHDEMIAVIAAHRDGKTLQVSNCGKWRDCGPGERLMDIIADIAGGDTFRVKPEPRRGFVADVVVYPTEAAARTCFPKATIIEVVEVVQ